MFLHTKKLLNALFIVSCFLLGMFAIQGVNAESGYWYEVGYETSMDEYRYFQAYYGKRDWVDSQTLKIKTYGGVWPTDKGEAWTLLLESFTAKWDAKHRLQFNWQFDGFIDAHSNTNLKLCKLEFYYGIDEYPLRYTYDTTQSWNSKSVSHFTEEYDLKADTSYNVFVKIRVWSTRSGEPIRVNFWDDGSLILERISFQLYSPLPP